MIIGIDGTAASGKGTLGRTLAMRLHFDYLDTGQLYRAVGYFALAKGLNLDVSDPKEIVKIATNLDLRQPFGKPESLRKVNDNDKKSIVKHSKV